MIILKGGEKKVLSIATAVSYEEKHVVMLEFNRNGEAMQAVNYDRKYYEDLLSRKILLDLQQRKDLIPKIKQAITPIVAKKIAKGIEFSE